MKRINEMNPYEKMKVNQLLGAIRSQADAALVCAQKGDEVNLFMSLSKIQTLSNDLASVMEIR
tara:strand:+ start:18168 stop:18356 length:189 start_codon:yes stop_codon:yes gene_type:complete